VGILGWHDASHSIPQAARPIPIPSKRYTKAREIKMTLNSIEHFMLCNKSMLVNRRRTSLTNKQERRPLTRIAIRLPVIFNININNMRFYARERTRVVRMYALYRCDGKQIPLQSSQILIGIAGTKYCSNMSAMCVAINTSALNVCKARLNECCSEKPMFGVHCLVKHG